MRRLGILKSSVDDAIADGVNAQGAAEVESVSSGAMSPEATMGYARLQAWEAQQRAAAGESTGTNLGAGISGGQGIGAASGAHAPYKLAWLEQCAKQAGDLAALRPCWAYRDEHHPSR